eukprot:g8371.t1
MQISDVEDLTALADKKAHKLAEELIPENVRHEVEVKSNSLRQKWHAFKEQNPQAQLITSFFAAILTFSLFFLDLFTDIYAIGKIMVTNKVYGYIMLVFLLFPFVVSMVGILVYVYKKFGLPRALILLPFLPFIQVLLDFTLPFVQLAGRCNLLNEDVYGFSVSYGAVRTLSESFLESFPQTIFQFFIFLTSGGAIQGEAKTALILSMIISLLSIIWHILGTFLASKAMGVTYQEYLITLVKMGGGLPLEPVRRNRIRSVNIDFTPDVKQFSMLMSLLASKKQSSVEEMDLSYSDGFKLDAMKVFSEYISSSPPKTKVGGDSDGNGNDINNFKVKTLIYEYNEKVNVEVLDELGNGMKTNASFEILRMGQNNFHSNERLQFLSFLKINTTLKELHLNDNNINSSGARIISDALVDNKGLQLLNLSQNAIDDTGINALFENMLVKNSTLTTLMLNSNNITKRCGIYIANGLKKNTGLEKLDISSNGLEDDGIVPIASSLSNNKTLEYIDLSNNNCQEAGARAFGASLSNNIALKTLIIIQCQLPIQDLRGKSDSIKTDYYDGSTMENVQLDKQGIGYYDSIIISKLLSTNEKTSKLNLERNNLNIKGCQEISKALSTNSSLKELSIASNQIGLEGIEAISNSLINNKTLESLDVSDNKLKKEGAEKLASGLEKSLKTGLKLKELLLEKNQIGSEGLKFLEKYVKETKTLEKLDLLGNNIGPDEGSNILSEILLANSSIKDLNLRYNKIAEGTSKLAKALETNITIQILILWRNDIDDISAIALADMLKKNKCIQHLDIQGNAIADEGIAAIGLALKQNSTLEELNLRFNHVGFEGSMGLAEGLKINNTMHTIVLQDNFLDDAAINNLEASTNKVEFFF